MENITSTLTPKQKQFADALQEFLSTRAADWGNEASLLMYGYKKFVTRDYFPILTDGNYIQRRGFEEYADYHPKPGNDKKYDTEC